MKDLFVSIVGFKNYFDKRPFPIGARLLCSKEPDNVYDEEAIRVTLPVLGTVGYIANSIQTKANGTLSAGRVYERVGDKFIVEVAFSTSSVVIARILPEDAAQDENRLLQGVVFEDEDEEA